MTMTLNPNGISHAATNINPQPGMGLMALMATAIPPTQMSVLPSIVDASKAAAAPMEAGMPLLPLSSTQPTPANCNGVSSIDECNNLAAGTGNGVGKFPVAANKSRQSGTASNPAPERSPTGSQILVPSTLKTSVSVNGEASGTNNNFNNTSGLSIVSTNGKLSQESPQISLEGENGNVVTITTAAPTAVVNDPSSKGGTDSYDPEEDVMYRV